MLNQQKTKEASLVANSGCEYYNYGDGNSMCRPKMTQLRSYLAVSRAVIILLLINLESNLENAEMYPDYR